MLITVAGRELYDTNSDNDDGRYNDDDNAIE